MGYGQVKGFLREILISWCSLNDESFERIWIWFLDGIILV